ILAQHSRMPGGHAKQRQRRSLRRSAPLLPVPQGVNADCERLGEFFLCEASESPKGDDVITTGDLPTQNSLSLLAGNCTRKVPCGQLGNLIHGNAFFRSLHTCLALLSWPFAR